jgi:hypothetical protein
MGNCVIDKRGKGVPIILSETQSLSGTKPEYHVIDDAELMLTIFAANPVKSESNLTFLSLLGTPNVS